MITWGPAATRARPFVGPLLITLGLLAGGVHLLISSPRRFPHMPVLLDAVTGYPAAALLFIFGVILTQNPPRTRSRAPRAFLHDTDRTTRMNQPQDTPHHTQSTTDPALAVST